MKNLISLFSSKYGKLKTIENKDRKMGESLEYVSVWVKDQNGNKKCLLFTETEIKNAETRASKNQEDIGQ